MSTAVMTPRERLFAILGDQPVDRVPIWLLFPYHKTSYYVDVRTHPAYRPVYEASKDKAIMLDRRNLGVPAWGPEVDIARETANEDGWTVERTRIRWRDVELTSETRRRGDECVIKKLLEDEDDLAAFVRMPKIEDPADIVAALDRRLPAYQAERAEFPARFGAMMLDLGEPVNAIYHSANLEEFAVWSLTCPELVEEALEREMRRLRVVYDYCLSRDLAEVYFLVGSELAAPPLVGPDVFDRWIVPYATELIGMIHRRGARAIQHFHGQIAEILPRFVDMGADGLHTIEAPPVGNCTFTEAFAVTKGRLALIGNIQYDEFHRLDADGMDRAVRAVIDECRGQRLILSPSAGPYEAVIPPRVTENYLRFLDSAWRHGRLSD